jgi:hypothetical protein
MLNSMELRAIWRLHAAGFSVGRVFLVNRRNPWTSYLYWRERQPCCQLNFDNGRRDSLYLRKMVSQSFLKRRRLAR